MTTAQPACGKIVDQCLPDEISRELHRIYGQVCPAKMLDAASGWRLGELHGEHFLVSERAPETSGLLPSFGQLIAQGSSDLVERSRGLMQPRPIPARQAGRLCACLRLDWHQRQ